MKQNKKGFTLIELLAVIVILAIIALIATPIILSMINNARKSAARSSALGYVESIEDYVGFYEAKQGGIDDIVGYEVPAPASTVTCSLSGGTYTGTGCEAFLKDVNATTKGKAPEAITKLVIENGKVKVPATAADRPTFTFSGYTCTYTGNDATCTKAN